MTKLKHPTLIPIVLAALLGLSLIIAGCGGGGGGSSSSTAGGGVGKSPVSGASVYARLADGSWTSAIGTTGTTGAITFTGLSSLSASDYPAVLKATGGTLNSGNGAAFTGELRGILESSTSQVYLTPASTMVAALYDQGITLADAQTQVRAIVQNLLGYTSVDPLGNFLASTAATQQNEVAQQALLFVLGISDAETNSGTMDNLLTKLQSTATQLATGSSFSTIAQAESGYDGTTSLATYISNNSAVINQIAADALGTTTASMTIPTVDTTTVFPDKFVVNTTTSDPGATRSAATLGADTSSSFTVDGNAGSTTYIKVGLTSTSPTGWDTTAHSQFTLTTAPSVGTLTLQDGTSVSAGSTFNAANAALDDGISNAMVFKYVVDASTTAQTVTIKVTASGVSTGATVARTLTINIVDASTTVAASSLTWSGSAVIKQLTDASGTGTSLSSGSTGSIATNDYQATVAILGSKTATQANGKYKMSFLAPDGFKFVVGSTNWDNYDQATLVDAGSGTFTATVPTTVTLVTTAAKPFGAYNFTARLIDKDDDSIERTTGDAVYFVRSGTTGWPAKIDTVRFNNGGGATSSVSLAVNGSDEIAFASQADFTGRVLTWSDVANETTTGPTSLSGTWYLIAGPMPSSGDYGFGNSTGGTMYANYDASTNSVATYSQPTITVDMASKYFTPNYGTGKSNQDTITLKYSDSTNGFSVESSGGVTLTSTAP
ncbi:hypothetical protein [Pseudodesulfovibrio tunisiensis]|uniref:hypothetical protein n=1 Tax=Pseudodesulfovibrio tunisiensis TaxID=463192 RepID=UPI001FB1FD57|nr:hypothetical protein [Pseudodesulfovibrio tunisiensis]